MTRRYCEWRDKMADTPRRRFLKGAAVSAAAAFAIPGSVNAESPPPDATGRRPASPLPPTQEVEHGSALRQEATVGSVLGGDHIVDVLRALDIEYIASVTGNTVKGLHESIINYGMVTPPRLDFVTCMHEETSVAFAHGYAKVEGKPMACMMHSTVGLQHGAMAIYNAWADRVPVFCLVGALLDAGQRRGNINWVHSVFDGPSLVRDFTKWDDTPLSLGSFAESACRAYEFSMTPPYGPVVLAVDGSLQMGVVPADRLPPIPRLPHVAPPQGEEGAVKEIARFLVSAEAPVILVDRAARTAEGLKLIIELAEALQASVVDAYGRFNFPWRHPLNQTCQRQATLQQADVVLGLELADWSWASQVPSAATRISISSGYLYLKSNYQDFNRFADVDIAVAADAEATLPSLVEAIKKLTPNDRRAVLQARGEKRAQAHAHALSVSKGLAAIGWDDTPISVARMCAELYEQIRMEDWALVSGSELQSFWPQQLWTADKHYQYIGDSGAYGLGYLPGASLGAALAHKKHGRLAVAIGGDGDLMFSSGALWTAAHERIPILYVIHNNRAYHAEVMLIQSVANARNRGIDRARIGTAFTDPCIDFAALARSMGVHGEGPIADPKDLGAAFKRAVAVVKAGEPVVVDVVSQGR
jgi:acetolactate synthase I/II/III large subunit